MKERMDTMREHKFSESLIARIVRGYKSHHKPVRRPKVLYRYDGGTVLRDAAVSMANRYGQVFEGEKSAGKNVAAETLAWIFHMPYYLVTFSEDMSSDDLLGARTTEDSPLSQYGQEDLKKMAKAELLVRSGYLMTESEEETQGLMDNAAEFAAAAAKSAAVSISHEETEFTEWLKYGGVLVCNEMNMGDPNFLASFMNQILDGTGFLSIAGMGRIPVHEDCAIIGTQNPGYTGTNIQNEATVSRLGVVSFGQAESIVNVLRANFEEGEVDEEVFKKCDNLYQALKETIGEDSQVNGNVLNIRGMVRAIKNYAECPEDAPLKQQLIIQIANPCEPDEKMLVVSKIEDIGFDDI